MGARAWTWMTGAACALGMLAGCILETRHELPRIHFMGNSITRAKTDSAIGWYHTAGMAATAPEKDYAHQTVRILKEKGLELELSLGPTDCVVCEGPITWHIENLWLVRELRPRYVVVQLGENSDDVQVRSGRLTREYRELLQGLKDSGVKKIFCMTNWAESSLEHPHNDAILKAIRSFTGIHVVDITSIADLPENKGDPARFSNVDVLWHPGDRGMLAMAEILAAEILKHR